MIMIYYNRNVRAKMQVQYLYDIGYYYPQRPAAAASVRARSSPVVSRSRSRARRAPGGTHSQKRNTAAAAFTTFDRSINRVVMRTNRARAYYYYHYYCSVRNIESFVFSDGISSQVKYIRDSVTIDTTTTTIIIIIECPLSPLSIKNRARVYIVITYYYYSPPPWWPLQLLLPAPESAAPSRTFRRLKTIYRVLFNIIR